MVDVKRTEVESPEEIARAIEHAEKTLGAGRVKYIHPDCGLWMLKRNMADGKIRALAYSADGRTLASAGSDWMTHVWDVATNRHLAVFAGHEGEVQAAAFTRDGATLATAGADGTIGLNRFIFRLGLPPS